MSLTPKQARFAAEYVVDLNGTQAAIRAGYAEKGAEVRASGLLRIGKVKAEIDRLVKQREARTEISQDRVVKELACIAFSDIRKAAHWNYSRMGLIPSDEIDDATAAAIGEVGNTNAGPKIKMLPKLPALDLLGRHLGMFRGEEGDNTKDAARALAAAFKEMAEADNGD